MENPSVIITVKTLIVSQTIVQQKSVTNPGVHPDAQPPGRLGGMAVANPADREVTF